jgi:predicted nucleic acid-binding protein
MVSYEMKVVFDTNVMVAAARSRQGASFALEVLTRPEHLPPGLTPGDVLRYVRYLASTAHLQEIHFLWRPFLADPDDDMVLELAVAAGCRYLVTHNVKDFRGSERLGVIALVPRDFLNQMQART